MTSRSSWFEVVNGFEPLKPRSIDQTVQDDLGNRARSIIWAEEITGAGLVSLRIHITIFILNQAAPDFRRHLQLIGTQCLNTHAERTPLTLRIPNLKWPLTVTCQSRRDFCAADYIDGRRERVSMKQIDESKAG